MNKLGLSWRNYPPLRSPDDPPPSKPVPGALARHVEAQVRDIRSCTNCGALGTKSGRTCTCPGCGAEWGVE